MALSPKIYDSPSLHGPSNPTWPIIGDGSMHLWRNTGGVDNAGLPRKYTDLIPSLCAIVGRRFCSLGTPSLNKCSIN